MGEQSQDASVKIRGICGRINLKQQRVAPTDIADEHGYWVRRCVPQIAQMSTDSGIYKICEYLWNPWENKSQAAEEISHRYRRLTQILGAKESPTDSTDEHGF